MSKLVIVESPSKAKTIKKYLGSGYSVIASNGHIRDLPTSKLGVDLENNFKPEYINIVGKGALIKDLKAAAEKSEAVFLATDPDREGEAISWHLAHILSLPASANNRVTFNEITKNAVISGMTNARPIDMNVVDAQQARRVLDRIVGYKISPFLWRKVRKGLSAGRVQSVATRLVVDRENEIRAFVPEEFWKIDAVLKGGKPAKSFEARLYSYCGKKLTVKSEAEAKKVEKELESASYSVASVKETEKKRNPAPPFITSTLQQEASRRFGFSVKKTMQIAQMLYEGVDLPDIGTTGLITYMRTDSPRISDDAKAAAKKYILSAYGSEYYPNGGRSYTTKAGAQDAHEAIRPSMPELTPASVKASLNSDQYKLYKLIWERFIASQMAAAKIDSIQYEIEAGDYIFRASDEKVSFPGFLCLYEEAQDDEKDKEKKKKLPVMKQGDTLAFEKLLTEQNFTQPPLRYTEATLVKALEERGIGRPSTYAPTITTIIQREYVAKNGKHLEPTHLGEVTTDIMLKHFSDIADYKFTADMEMKLDDIEKGTNWISVLDSFYKDFKNTLSAAEKDLDGVKIAVPDEVTDQVCELCGRNMVIKSGKFGKFLACPGYPTCKNTKAIVVETDGKCPKCGGKMLARKSKKGDRYYACENHGKCDFMTWDTPIKDACPKCGSPLFKKSRSRGVTHCLKDGCGYTTERKNGEK